MVLCLFLLSSTSTPILVPWPLPIYKKNFVSFPINCGNLQLWSRCFAPTSLFPPSLKPYQTMLPILPPNFFFHFTSHYHKNFHRRIEFWIFNDWWWGFFAHQLFPCVERILKSFFFSATFSIMNSDGRYASPFQKGSTIVRLMPLKFHISVPCMRSQSSLQLMLLHILHFLNDFT